jgi:hypothetical protein
MVIINRLLFDIDLGMYINLCVQSLSLYTQHTSSTVVHTSIHLLTTQMTLSKYTFQCTIERGSKMRMTESTNVQC